MQKLSTVRQTSEDLRQSGLHPGTVSSAPPSATKAGVGPSSVAFPRINPASVEFANVKTKATSRANSEPLRNAYNDILVLMERFFAGQMDQAAFEDSIRTTLGPKAYLLYTVDKVSAAVLKTVSQTSLVMLVVRFAFV